VDLAALDESALAKRVLDRLAQRLAAVDPEEARRHCVQAELDQIVEETSDDGGILCRAKMHTERLFFARSARACCAKSALSFLLGRGSPVKPVKPVAALGVAVFETKRWLDLEDSSSAPSAPPLKR
jgi:hypothetical protein